MLIVKLSLGCASPLVFDLLNTPRQYVVLCISNCISLVFSEQLAGL